jgi:DNA modification methylase
MEDGGGMMGDDVTLWLGDCLERMAEIPDASVDCIVTDPPYGIEYATGNHADCDRSEGKRSNGHVEWASIAGDDRPDGRWLAEAFRVLKPGAAIYLVTRWDVEPEWRDLLRSSDFRVMQRLVWHKRVHGKGDLTGTWATTCEDVLFASKGRHRLNKRPSMLLDVGCVPTWEKRFHPHQKPVALPERLILNSTQAGDVVLDPFMGSGTTGMACFNADRRFVGIEKDPAIFATASRRLAAHLASTPLLKGAS